MGGVLPPGDLSKAASSTRTVWRNSSADLSSSRALSISSRAFCSVCMNAARTSSVSTASTRSSIPAKSSPPCAASCRSFAFWTTMSCRASRTAAGSCIETEPFVMSPRGDASARIMVLPSPGMLKSSEASLCAFSAVCSVGSRATGSALFKKSLSTVCGRHGQQRKQKNKKKREKRPVVRHPRLQVDHGRLR